MTWAPGTLRSVTTCLLQYLLRVREGGFKHPSLSMGKVIVVDQPDASGEVLARLPSVTLVRVAAPLDTVLDHALAHLGVITSE